VTKQVTPNRPLPFITLLKFPETGHFETMLPTTAAGKGIIFDSLFFPNTFYYYSLVLFSFFYDYIFPLLTRKSFSYFFFGLFPFLGFAFA
jgi:hypothetical protein